MLYGSVISFSTSFTQNTNRDSFTITSITGTWLLILDRCLYQLMNQNILKTGDHLWATQTKMDAFGSSRLGHQYRDQLHFLTSLQTKKAILGICVSFHSRNLWFVTKDHLSKLMKLIFITKVSGTIHATTKLKECLTIAVLICLNHFLRCTDSDLWAAR